jgi:hypothetical protein
MALRAVQKENHLRGKNTRNPSWLKKWRHKKERQAIRKNVTSPTLYKKYEGWEF